MVVIVALWASHCVYTVQFSSSSTWCISTSPKKNLSLVKVITFYHYQHLWEDNGWMMRGVPMRGMPCAPDQWFSKCARQIPRDLRPVPRGCMDTLL